MKSFCIKLLLSLLLVVTLLGCSTAIKKDKTLDEKKFDLFFGEGTAHLIEKNYTDALKYLLKAYDIFPKHSKLLNNLGMSYYFKKKLELAEVYLSKSVRYDPKNSDARNNLASLFFIKGQNKKAKEQYNLILEDLIYKYHYRVHHNLGLIHFREKDYDKSLKEMKLATSLKEDYCSANFQLGKIYYKMKKYKTAALSFYNAQKGTCVTEPLPHWNQALTYIKLNDLKSARLKLNAIIERFGATRFSAMASTKLRKISSLEMIEDREDLLLKEKYFGKR